MSALTALVQRVYPPDVQEQVLISQFTDANKALKAWRAFNELCMKYRVDVVASTSPVITVTGRPRRVAAFKRDVEFLHTMGLV